MPLSVSHRFMTDFNESYFDFNPENADINILLKELKLVQGCDIFFILQTNEQRPTSNYQGNSS